MKDSDNLGAQFLNCEFGQTRSDSIVCEAHAEHVRLPQGYLWVARGRSDEDYRVSVKDLTQHQGLGTPLTPYSRRDAGIGHPLGRRSYRLRCIIVAEPYELHVKGWIFSLERGSRDLKPRIDRVDRLIALVSKPQN